MLYGCPCHLQEARNTFALSSTSVATKSIPRQLVLLLSDGRFDRENKDRLRNLVREMNERGQLLVLIGEALIMEYFPFPIPTVFIVVS